MIKIGEYYFPDCIGDKHDYFTRHMTDGDEALKYLKKTDRGTVIQAGGHVGLWPINLAKNFRRVITFEPNPENWECVVQNTITTLETKIQSHRAGLSSVTGQFPLVRSDVNTGGHYVNKDFSEDCDVIDLMRVDDLDLTECTAIFLDVEGHELEALKGAIDTIEEYSPLLMLEVKDHINKGGCTQDQLEMNLAHLGYSKVGQKAHDSIYIRA